MDRERPAGRVNGSFDFKFLEYYSERLHKSHPPRFVFLAFHVDRTKPRAHV